MNKKIQEFVNTNYSFFTEDTRNKMILAIDNYIKNKNTSIKDSWDKSEVIEIAKKAIAFGINLEAGNLEGYFGQSISPEDKWIEEQNF